MRLKRLHSAAALFVMAAFSAVVPVASANHQNAEVIIEWDQLLQQNLAGSLLRSTLRR